MRKIILIFISSFIAMISVAQQKDLPEEFFGLKFGEAYTQEQIVNAMRNLGEHFDIDNSEPFNMGGTLYLRYGFKNVTYEGRTYPLLILMTLKDGTFAMVDFIIPADTDNRASLDSTYNVIKNELSKNYELTSFPMQEHPEMDRMLTINNGITLRFDKFTENGQTSSLEISYVYLFASIMERFRNHLPEIQDLFFGIKMGSSQNRESINTAISYRGRFLEENFTSKGKNITFSDVSFAGTTWDYADFYLTEDNLLYEVLFYLSLDDYGSYSDEWKRAENTYEYYKQKLDDKYGEAEDKSSDDEVYASYFGNNNMAVIISNKRSQSKGGAYRRYVTLDYIQTDLYNQVNEKLDNEL